MIRDDELPQDTDELLSSLRETGSIIHGTHRAQDLIPAFLTALSVHDPAAYAQLVANGGTVPAYVQDEGDDSEWWDSEDCAWLLEQLFDSLDDAAPEGYYFGAHPGDGSDFGFWEIEDNL